MREQFRIDFALDALHERAWDAGPGAPERRAELLAGEAAPLKRELLRVWHLAFDFDSEDNLDQPQPGTTAHRAATAIIAQLAAGADFAELAAAAPRASWDTRLRGDLGLMPLDQLAYVGLSAEHLAREPSGRFRAPVAQYGRWHVTAWATPSDDELVAFCRRRFLDQRRAAFIADTIAASGVRYRGEGVQLAAPALPLPVP